MSVMVESGEHNHKCTISDKIGKHYSAKQSTAHEYLKHTHTHVRPCVKGGMRKEKKKKKSDVTRRDKKKRNGAALGGKENAKTIR